MLTFKHLQMFDDPYPVGVATGVFDWHTYSTLLYTYPDEMLFRKMGGGYNKLSLSERNNSSEYAFFIGTSPPWQDLHAYVKTRLIDDVRAVVALPDAAYTARFEFSSMPADGGFILPHTDIASKVVTLVVPIIQAGAWSEEWGGGTDILRPHREGLKDYLCSVEDFDRVMTVEYKPNQALVFIKNDHSWHSVGPFTGPKGVWRRSLTVNIERVS